MPIIESEKGKIRYGAQRYLNSQSALSFDGVDDYIDLGNEPEYNFTNQNNFSISLFAKVTEFGQGGETFRLRCLISKMTNPTASTLKGWYIGSRFADSRNGFKFATYDNAGYNSESVIIDTYSNNRNLQLNEWYHIGVTYDSSKNMWRMYLNAQIVAEKVQSVSDFNNNGSLQLGIGKGTSQGGLNHYYSGQLAGVQLYNKALDQGEVSALHTWKGYIPESAQPNLVEYQPLQYNNFVNDTVFKDVDTNTFPVNQTAHGLNVGDIIAFDGTSWSNYTNILPMQTPQVVVEVVDADNFVYSKSGKYTFPSAHNLGNTGDVIYRDGTTVGKDNPIYKILSPTEIQIASKLALWCVGARKQFNWKKASNDVLEESYGQVFGKTKVELGIDNPTHQSHIDFYGKTADITTGLDWGARGKASTMNMEATNISSFISNGGTFSFYISIVFYNIGNKQCILHPYSTQGTNGSRFLSLYFGQLILGYHNPISIAPEAQSGIFLKPNVKYYVLLTYDSATTTYNLYVYDGNDLKTFSRAGSTWSYRFDTKLRIGRTTNSNNGTLGVISSFGFSDTVENQSVITEKDFSTFFSNVNFAVMNDAETIISDNQGNVNYRFASFGTSESQQQYDFTGEGLTVELKSLYPPITQGIHLQNINSGGDRDMWIELDKSDLPNASDDFTFHWSGVVNKSDTGTFTKILEVLFTLDINDVFQTKDCISFLYYPIWEINFMSEINKSLRIVSADGDTVPFSGNTSIRNVEYTIVSMTITRSYSKVKYYFNGVLLNEVNDVSFNYTSVNNFSLSTKPSYQGNSSQVEFRNANHVSFGYWKRALSNLEILHLHGEGKPNNPWDNLPSDYNANMKQGLKIWHQFQEGSIYQDGTDFKIKNWADDSGSTDAVLKEANANGGTLLDLQGWRDRVRTLNG